MTSTYDIIGLGSYSIVITPTITTHITEVKKYENPSENDVCKIFRTEQDCEEDFMDEISILNKLSSIPNYTDFTVEYKGASTFNISQVRHDTRILKHIMKDDYYNIYKRMFSNTHKTLYQITFGYGGICINKLNEKIDFELFVNIMLQCYQGISKLHENDIIHRDLKPTNILYNEKQIKIIDFGLACNINDVYDYTKSKFLLKHNYPFNPPEFFLASLLFEQVKDIKHVDEKGNIDIEKVLQNTLNFFNDDNEIFQNYFSTHCFELQDISIHSYIFAFQQMIEEIKKRNYQTIDDIFTKEMIYKVDVFSSSFIIRTLKKRIIFQSNEQLEFYENLYQMTRSLNPFQRGNITDILIFLRSWKI